MSTIKFDTWRNSDNSENGKVRLWADFNGTGTVAIRGSLNVSSITDNGVGDYTVNFSITLPDTNYVPLQPVNTSLVVTAHNARTTTSCRVNVFSVAGTPTDVAVTSLAILR